MLFLNPGSLGDASGWLFTRYDDGHVAMMDFFDTRVIWIFGIVRSDGLG